MSAMTRIGDINYGNDPLFWSGKRVFVTGNTGFKGAWLTVWLHELGATVAGYSLPPPTLPNMFAAVGVVRLSAQTVGDVRDLDTLRAAITGFRPDIVVHLAAQAIVRASYDGPVETFATNVQGTANVLEACRGLTNLRAIVVCTSDKCYDNDESGRAFREDDRLGGRDPYSASKACAELVTAAYRQSFFAPERYRQHGVAVASARAGNVIGGGDWGIDRILPDAARAFSAGLPLVIRSPQARRPWQFVLEPLAGYLALARALVELGGQFAAAWNFGPFDDSVWPVEQLVQRFAAEWGADARIVIDAGPETRHEAGMLRLDSSQATALLGWRPRADVGGALGRSAAWYKAYYGGMPPAELETLTRSQIRSYAAAGAVAAR